MDSAQHRGSLMRAIAPRRRWALAASMAGLLFVGMYAQAEEHPMVCICSGCAMAASGSGSDVDDPETFRVSDRWLSTAYGSAGSRGDAVSLTWGFVGDGTSITRAGSIAAEASGPSVLIARLDTIYGVSSTSDLTQSAWFDEFEDSYNRWGEISGLTFVYEANDDGQEIRSSIDGVLGVRADMRIGGHSIDGNSGVLAYNYFPDTGNMVIDTNDSFYTNTGSNSIRLRNVVMHEVGHGLGFSHLESGNSSQLMEPFINTSFYGPQHDDILAAQRNYGDALEKGNGNDTTGNATDLGTFTGAPATFSVGTDADDNTSFVAESETDFISIDGTSDVDIFGFTLSGGTDFNISILMDPKGPTYNEGAQGGSQSALNTKALADLELELLDSGGSLILAASTNGAGLSELINTVLSAGDYFARVSTAAGSDDNVQMYRLDISAEFVPEPNGVAILGVGGLLLMRRRRRAA